MKSLELIFNHLSFGAYYPIFLCNEIAQVFFESVWSRITRKCLSKKKIDKVQKDYQTASAYNTELYKFYDMWFIDVISGISMVCIIVIIIAYLFTWNVIVSHTFLSRILLISVLAFVYLFIYYFFLRNGKREKYFAEFFKESKTSKCMWAFASYFSFIFVWTCAIVLLNKI